MLREGHRAGKNLSYLCAKGQFSSETSKERKPMQNQLTDAYLENDSKNEAEKNRRYSSRGCAVTFICSN